jgi:FtsP/CotA-like multicopper oxidase with cupredoxin domain
VAAINDNRTPAGVMRDGALELRLVAQLATWLPEGDTGCGISMVALGEEGKTAQIPGPLIRVPLGTRLRITVRNAHSIALTLRGLRDRIADSVARRVGATRATFGALGDFSGVAIEPDSSRTFEFQVTQPGTFFYHAARQNTPPGAVSADFVSQAVGAFVVDPPGGSPPDRIFVMTRWRGPANSVARAQRWELLAFNGRSWPHTETLTATVGDTLRWRVISANNDGHAMHLHGFYFTVQSKGTLAYDSPFAPEAQPLVVTEGLGPGRTMTMRWIPERPGNWIFHCHVMRHMSGAQRLDRMPDSAGAKKAPDPAHDSHALHEMAGLVMGITVNSAAGTRPRAEETSRTRLRLFANRRDSVFGSHPAYGFVLQDGATAPARDSVRIPGSLLLLRRGQPTQITVINRTGGALGVHWHGLELESYYDGVTGWSGAGERIAPPIANNDSFVVRMTPPRAGTFIYHVHNEHGEELPSGLYGALLVLEPGTRWDPELDKLFLFSEPGPGAGLGFEKPPFVNGSATPDTLELVAGRAYRFRIISISASVAHSLALKQDGRVVEWRPLARDGADLAPSLRRPEPASYPVIDEGVTLDFEFRAPSPGAFTLELAPITPQTGRLQPPTVVSIRVRSP